MAGEQRITIGFQGQALPVRASAEQIAAFREALRAGQGGWHDLETEDGSIFLDLGRVEYVRTDAHEQRVGFGL